MAWSLTMTGVFEGEDGPKKEQQFLARVKRLAKDWGATSGRLYGDYVGEQDLEPTEDE